MNQTWDLATVADRLVLDAENKGVTIYTVLRHVSQSGMTRVIDAFMIVDGTPVSLRSALVQAGFKVHPTHDGVKITGAGMDMGFHLVYTLGMAAHGDGYHFSQRWL